MKWFKHDSDASNDAKLKKLRLKYGAQGYGIYWYCLELIARNVEKHNLTFELEHDAELIADDFKLSSDLVQHIMTYMVELELFENIDGVISCLKMANRTDEYTQQLLKGSKKLPIMSRETPESVPRMSEVREEKRIEQNRTEEIKTIVNSVAVDDCPHQDIIKLYLSILPMGIKPLTWDGIRASSLKARWREQSKRQNLEWWKGLFEYIAKSEFLTGQITSENRKPFVISLDWIVKAENFRKITEGKYHG